MLGAVKDEGTEQIPLFRLLARRWKSLGPPKRSRAVRAALTPAEEEQPKAPRAWIAKPRQIYAHQKISAPKVARSWNPWLWVK